MMGVGMILGSSLGYAIPQSIGFLNSSLYERGPLEAIMEKWLGYKNMEDALTDEILVVAYNYNG